MVGVPGKSKGCVTCKKRRIKCDEAKPTCKRCEKAGYKCGGYSTGTIFVNKSTAPFEDDRGQSSKSIQYINNVPVKVVPRMRTAEVPPEMSLVAFQSDICTSYMLSNFIWRTYGHGWLEAAAAEADSLGSWAVKALSSIFFGISHHQEDVQMKATLQYGQAVSLLRPALSDPSKPGIEELIVPIMLMLMHASYEEEQSASVAHLRGLITILHIAGPAKFQRGVVHKAFESARATLTTSHLIARRRLFLEQDIWKTIPWALQTSSKSQQNLLVDMLVDIPGYLQDDNELQDSPDPVAHASLLARVKSTLYTLYNWRYVWEMLNPSTAYETMPPAIQPKKRIIPRLLHFQTHSQAAEILLYNAVHMWLIGLLLRLRPDDTTTILATATAAATDANFPSSSFPRGPLRLPDDTTSLRDPAIEIVRAFEFQMTNPEANRESSLFFLFPLGIAWTVLEREPEYRRWIRDMLDEREVTKGYAIGRNVWFGHYYMPKVFAIRNSSEPILIGVWKCPGCGESACNGGGAGHGTLPKENWQPMLAERRFEARRN